METYLNRIVDYVLTQSWQIAVLVAVVAIVNLALRNRSAHVRYLLWLIVLAKCLVPPLLTVPLAVLPQAQTMPAPIFEGPIESQAAPVSVPSMPVRPALPARAVVAGSARLDPRQWLALAWIGGVAAFVFIAAVKALRTQLWLRQSRKPLPVELQAGIADLFSSLDLKKFPKVWLVEGIGQPFVWGLLRGGIYLPANFVKVNSPEHRRGVLGHELSHVLRFDASVNLLQTIAQALFWFHPFVWWANKRIRAEREKCCDEMTIARLNAPVKDYSRAIVDTVVNEYESTRPIPSLAVAGPVKNIEERIKAMLRPGKKFYKRPSLVASIVVLLIAFLIVPTALVFTAEAKEKTPADPSPTPTEKNKAAATAELFRAIRDTNVERMRLAINRGADLEAKNKDAIFLIDNVQSLGRTPLYVAAGIPDVDENLIKLLLEAGANPNTRNPDGQIPLHAAARGWHISPVELLISGGSDVNAADKDGRTPAIIAFELGHYDMFDLIVGSGATVPNDLMSAYKGNMSRVQSLIENGKAHGRFEQSLTLLHVAAAGGHTAIVELLLTNGLDVRLKTHKGYTALHYAVAGNHQEVAELLISKGIDVNTEPGKVDSPLHWAVRGQHKDMVDWLLARGANPNADGGGSWATPLHWAVWTEDVNTALLLVSHGGDIHLVTQNYPVSPLFDSIIQGDPAMAEALVKKAGDTRAAKWAPLHATVVSGDIQAVKALLIGGADVNIKNKRGLSALHSAAVFGHENISKLLIAKGAEVNAKAEGSLWDQGMTALHSSCVRGQKSVAELLIAKGANINAKSNNGYTPLHVAAARGYKDVAELLIAKGADINAKDNEGRIALSLAKEHGWDEVVELLRKHGVKG